MKRGCTRNKLSMENLHGEFDILFLKKRKF